MRIFMLKNKVNAFVIDLNYYVLHTSIEKYSNLLPKFAIGVLYGNKA